MVFRMISADAFSGRIDDVRLEKKRHAAAELPLYGARGRRDPAPDAVRRKEVFQQKALCIVGK